MIIFFDFSVTIIYAIRNTKMFPINNFNDISFGMYVYFQHGELQIMSGSCAWSSKLVSSSLPLLQKQPDGRFRVTEKLEWTDVTIPDNDSELYHTKKFIGTFEMERSEGSRETFTRELAFVLFAVVYPRGGVIRNGLICCQIRACDP